MPIQQRARGNDGGDLLEPMPTDVFGDSRRVVTWRAPQQDAVRLLGHAVTPLLVQQPPER
jgi:hypothetical protein